MKNRTKSAFAGVAVVAVALSAAVTAHGEPTPTPKPTTVTLPDLQGSGCDALKKELTATDPNALQTLSKQSVSANIAAIPELSTFSSAISGGVNPAVNVVGVLDNGPYTVFAPTNDAFAKLDPGTLELLKSNPAALTDVLYYHMVLSILGVDDVHGKLTTQQGKQVTVEGKGGDIKVDGAKVLCGAITGGNSRIYLIDTVLDPAKALPADQTKASPTSSSPSSTPSSSPSAPAAAEAAPPAA
ncbi:fasciclin domain-containing protein [Mycobacterium sp. MYCO198283]|uniref:fasciclin domain-containing protein n=1 Tax=Mycobacterium sp. MYCO198283 TaxID=2883505 RepID=UPI001E29B9F5|nr:fasciclin domain-containing protein [Mycobacterium sp. MYCO198283]MCG5430832.1 fasciclin domain-containing protein [Mycobacterium sp. MYCO198283]